MPKINIYTRRMCGYCSAAKSLLKSKGLLFNELDATLSPKLRQEMIQKSNGGATFPQIFIGNHHVGGFDELSGLETAGKLDALLEG